jgi:hypothetical protein
MSIGLKKLFEGLMQAYGKIAMPYEKRNSHER